MLRPELQDPAEFVDAVDNIVATHSRVALHYFNDGSIEWACPPLRALLHIMRDGNFEGKSLEHPEIRALFSRENLLTSDWYEERLKTQQAQDVRRWQARVRYMEQFLAKQSYADEVERLELRQRLSAARVRLDQAKHRDYLESLRGTIGGEPAIPLVSAR
jgi:hypothetical protein